MRSVLRWKIFDFVVFISTKRKTDCISSPFFLLVRMVWMRTNVQAADKLTRNRSVATSGSGAQLVPRAVRGAVQIPTVAILRSPRTAPAVLFSFPFIRDPHSKALPFVRFSPGKGGSARYADRHGIFLGFALQKHPYTALFVQESRDFSTVFPGRFSTSCGKLCGHLPRFSEKTM